MIRAPLADGRLRAFVLLLAPCFVGHAIQGFSEDAPFWRSDVPWAELAARRFWITPGWHLYLPTWLPLAIAALMAIAAIAATLTRRRDVFLVLTGLYVAHYLTYPFRVRNHMSTMLFGLSVVALVWLVARREPAKSARTVDRLAAGGLAAVITVQYFFAGLHKMNPVFTDPSLDGESVAIGGLRTFWLYGDLGDEPPHWVCLAAVWGTIAIETCVPAIALLVPRLGYVAVVVLMAFNLPIIAAMDIADYPLIASAFFPALLTPARWRLLTRHLGPSAWTFAGAALGAGTQVWFIPWWGPMSIFGIFVLALWGWALGALAKLTIAGLRRRQRA